MTASSTPAQPLVGVTAWLAAALGRRPRIGPLHGGVATGRFQHSEWSALLSRFVQDGRVDYAGMVRVRRLVEVYLSRLAEHDPETFIDADDQLAFYLNAYNAIAVHQVVLHYPVRSIQTIPGAFVRPYPIGRRNVALHTLHGGLLRAFGDPRVHLALSPAALGGAQIQPLAFTGTGLQATLDAALRRFLADPARGARYDAATETLWLSPIIRWFAGDLLEPTAMPQLGNLVRGWSRSSGLLRVLRPHMPAELAAALPPRPIIQTLPFDWRLNDRADHAAVSHPVRRSL